MKMNRAALVGMVTALSIMHSAMLSAATCTWTGGGDGSRWDDVRNWQDGAKPSTGDVVVLQSDVVGTEMTNDIGELSIAGLMFFGDNAMTLFSPKLTLTGSLKTRNASTINCDLHFTVNASIACGDRPNGSREFPQTTCEPTFNGNIIIADDKILYVTGDSGAQFNGTVTGTAAYLKNGSISYSQGKFHFNRPVCVKEISHYIADQCIFYFNAAGNHYEKFTSSYTYYYFTVADAMAPEGVIAFDNSGELKAYRGYYLYADQTINRFDGSTNPGTTDAHYFTVADESRHIEVVARGTANGSSYVRLCNNMGFTWAPTNNFTQEFVDRTHSIKGPIVVSNGTIRMSGTCSFKNVSQLTVKKNATFHHASTASAALNNATLVTLEDGATFKVDAGATDPFTKSPMFIMGRSAKIDVADGATVSIGDVKTPGGTFPATGTYTGTGSIGTRVDWITGAGTVNVTASGVVAWSRAANGAFTASANWDGGVLPSVGVPAYITVNGADYTVLLSSAPAATAGGLRLANDGEHTNILAVSAAATFSGEKIDVSSGGRIEVNDGGMFEYIAPSSYWNEYAFLVHDGGRVEVNGGTLRNYNLCGQLALSGTDVAEGVLAIHDGTCLVHNDYGGKGLMIYSGGRLEMDGGLLDLRLYTNRRRPLTLAGGTMYIGGDAEVRIGNGLGLYFGDGTADFSGDATLTYAQSGARLAISPRMASDVTRLTFMGNSSLALSGATATFVGFDGPDGSKAILRHASSAISYSGAICSVGDRTGYGELDIESGRFHCGDYGLYIGASTYDNTNPDGSRSEGKVKVSGGILSIDGSQSAGAGNRANYGLVVGDGIVVSNGTASTSFHKGSLEIYDDGVVSNMAGFASVGLGKANGVVRQTGGLYVSTASRATTIGSFGGEGEWSIVGGTASVAANLYVGGCLISDWGKSSTYPMYSVTSGSQGRLSVANGSFSVGGNAYVGKNGTGLVELGTGGVFNVTGNADMCSGATLKFVFGPSGTGAVRVGGNFVVDGGAHLVLDLSSYGDNSGRYRLVQAARTLGEFDLANVEIIGKPDTQRFTLTSRNGVLSCSIGRGFILIVE